MGFFSVVAMMKFDGRLRVTPFDMTDWFVTRVLSAEK